GFLIACTVNFPVLSNDHISTLPQKVIDPDKAYRVAVEAVRDKKYTIAVEHFEILAKQSQHDAQYNLALLLKQGLGVPQNYPEALKWTWLAHLGGVKKAQGLADMLLDLVPEKRQDKTRDQVSDILTERIETGDLNALTQFARFHLDVLIEPDYETAYSWYSVAAALKMPGGIRGREDVIEEVDPEKLVDLQDKATEIFKNLTSPK
ncbi:MAG: tetratricopeptide repeat protein, partial [Pseudomonadota bacterium]|nr:tetratricopeptide repeat protein [Pseudomonadota bacterium]